MHKMTSEKSHERLDGSLNESNSKRSLEYNKLKQLCNNLHKEIPLSYRQLSVDKIKFYLTDIKLNAGQYPNKIVTDGPMELKKIVHAEACKRWNAKNPCREQKLKWYYNNKQTVYNCNKNSVAIKQYYDIDRYFKKLCKIRL